MNDLKRTIEGLASEFAMSIIGALRAASIDEITSVAGTSGRRGAPGRAAAAEGGAPARSRSRRLGRRSADDIGRVLDSIASLLASHPEGLRAEQIRDELGCESKELPRPLADGLTQGRLTKTGQKRATKYFLAGDGGSAPSKRRGRGRRAKRG